MWTHWSKLYKKWNQHWFHCPAPPQLLAQLSSRQFRSCSCEFSSWRLTSPNRCCHGATHTHGWAQCLAPPRDGEGYPFSRWSAQISPNTSSTGWSTHAEEVGGCVASVWTNRFEEQTCKEYSPSCSLAVRTKRWTSNMGQIWVHFATLLWQQQPGLRIKLNILSQDCTEGWYG